MRAAKLRHVGAVPEDVDYRTARRLDKPLFQQLLTGKWIRDRRNLIITGPCGVGKTWLACALGHQACRENATVLYKRATRLFSELELAHADGRYPRLFRSHMFVDHELLEAPTFGCYFDGMFSLTGAPGKVEKLTGACSTATDSGDRKASFRLTYSDADNATLEISGFDAPFVLVACD